MQFGLVIVRFVWLYDIKDLCLGVANMTGEVVKLAICNYLLTMFSDVIICTHAQRNTKVSVWVILRVILEIKSCKVVVSCMVPSQFVTLPE